eukprot:m.477434 g.477434  ORF g.477434 m.477434 type:complete len:515 (+) comp20845_c0_seq1:1038-2582(+)
MAGTRPFVMLTVLLATVGMPEAIPINPRMFGFSSYIGAVVNLTFEDPAVLRVMDTLHVGSLRYPGGSIANVWNLSTGRWVPSVQDEYADRTAAFPAGTFGPARYWAAFGSRIATPNIWNLNLITDPDPPAQLDLLKSIGVPVEYVELGNEKADENLEAYLAAARPVVKRTRELFPKAKVSAVGCFGLNWGSCSAKLKPEAEAGLFDAVSIHKYAPTNATIMRQKTDADRRAATVGAPYGLVAGIEAQVASDISPRTAVWLDEFNWGGSWSGAVTWPTETHGALRGLTWAAYVLAAMDVTAAARAANRTGFDAAMSYSLFYQESSPWSHWAACARVPDQLGQADRVAFGGVAQIIAHVNHVALKSGYTEYAGWQHDLVIDGNDGTVRGVAEAATGASRPSRSSPPPPHRLGLGSGTQCVQGVTFYHPGTIGTASVVLNVCPEAVHIANASHWWPGYGQTADVSQYSGFDIGGWVTADTIGSLASPPWINGPLLVVRTTAFPTSLPPISLTILKRT